MSSMISVTFNIQFAMIIVLNFLIFLPKTCQVLHIRSSIGDANLALRTAAVAQAPSYRTRP